MQECSPSLEAIQSIRASGPDWPAGLGQRLISVPYGVHVSTVLTCVTAQTPGGLNVVVFPTVTDLSWQWEQTRWQEQLTPNHVMLHPDMPPHAQRDVLDQIRHGETSWVWVNASQCMSTRFCQALQETPQPGAMLVWEADSVWASDNSPYASLASVWTEPLFQEFSGWLAHRPLPKPHILALAERFQLEEYHQNTVMACDIQSLTLHVHRLLTQYQKQRWIQRHLQAHAGPNDLTLVVCPSDQILQHLAKTLQVNANACWPSSLTADEVVSRLEACHNLTTRLMLLHTRVYAHVPLATLVSRHVHVVHGAIPAQALSLWQRFLTGVASGSSVYHHVLYTREDWQQHQDHIHRRFEPRTWGRREAMKALNALRTWCVFPTSCQRGILDHFSEDFSRPHAPCQQCDGCQRVSGSFGWRNLGRFFLY